METDKLRSISVKDFKKLTAILVTAALFAAVWIGLKMPSGKGFSVAVLSPVSGKDALTGAAMLCFPDLLSAALLTVSGGRAFTYAAALSVFFLRGLAIGHTANFCVVNSVNSAAIGAFISYCAVTLLLAVYAVFIREEKGETGAFFKMLCYFTVSGASVVLRVVPYLFIS